MRPILPILTSRSSNLVLGPNAGLFGQSPAAGKAQNAAVRHISSAFKVQHNPNRTTPPTMGILPVDLRLSLLIKNVALRLYRLPTNSQLVVAVSHADGPRGTAPPSEIGTVMCRCAHILVSMFHVGRISSSHATVPHHVI